MQDLVEFGTQFLNIPYCLGSLDPSIGLDCATFILHFFEKLDGKKLNIDIPKNAVVNHRTHLHFYEKCINLYCHSNPYPCNLQIGDLLIFRNYSTSSHVGINLGRGKFIHCAEDVGVRIHKLALCKSKLVAVGTFKPEVRAV